MICLRCQDQMLMMHRQETEVCGEFTLITDIVINECPTCSAMVKGILPQIPTEELERIT